VAACGWAPPISRRWVEGFEEVADYLAIDTSRLGATEEGELLCFLVRLFVMKRGEALTTRSSA
jgi:hypothetical protein